MECSWSLLGRLGMGQVLSGQQHFFEPGAQRLDLDPAGDIIGKRVGKQDACVFLSMCCRPSARYRPLTVDSQLSASSRTRTSLRTKAPPRPTKCVEKLLPRCCWTCVVAVWKASRLSR